MPGIDKPLLRLAVAIREELASHLSRDRLIQLPDGSWDRCTQLNRQIRRAQLRGWHLAEHELLKDLRYMLSSVQSELAAILRELPPMPENDRLTTTGGIYLDLLAVEKEFNEVSYDLRGHWLGVTTEPITLQDIYLGPFEIRLNWARASNGSETTYRVIAKDPHPAESNESVTHPHVMSEQLCEGDSRHAIRQAIAQGRLLDFFTLVANGLRTYNPESPFVELALWHGGNCSDCGAYVDDDDRFVCQKCDATICGGCECSCSGCDDSCCTQCITGCEVCDDNYCRSCLQRCPGCRRSICSNCLEEDERCSTCHEKDRQKQNEVAATDHAPIQPHGVGQAPVFA
jgi:hypothetical protein